jgi:predicted HTH transcriptional regulator
MATPSPPERELRSLLDYPTEDVSTEIKEWLDLSGKSTRANLARELLALANHGGGYVLFGFAESTTGWQPSGACPHDLKYYSQDEINNILKAHAEPVFECYVHHLQSTSGAHHVVIQIPGGHVVPVRSRGGPAASRLTDRTYYIRRPGPESAPPDNGHEWDALITRCVDNNRERQLESFRRIIDLLLRSSPEVSTAIAGLASGVPDLLSDWMEQSLGRASQHDDPHGN